jgi:hypothetical protein
VPTEPLGVEGAGVCVGHAHCCLDEPEVAGAQLVVLSDRHADVRCCSRMPLIPAGATMVTSLSPRGRDLVPAHDHAGGAADRAFVYAGT